MNYEDIIHLPRPVSQKHPPMSMLDRAAQFAPFAALTGHADMITEAERLTQSPAELTESAKEELDQTLQILREGMTVVVRAFLPDSRKDGGCYHEYIGQVRRADPQDQSLTLTDGTHIPFNTITHLEIPG